MVADIDPHVIGITESWLCNVQAMQCLGRIYEKEGEVE